MIEFLFVFVFVFASLLLSAGAGAAAAATLAACCPRQLTVVADLALTFVNNLVLV
jgi:hypothetical protein